MTQPGHWHQRIGAQRDWVWRGWQTRYTYVRASQANGEPTTPLILIHGFGASVEHWRQNIPALSHKHAVYALDLLGFGASRKAPADYKVDLWVQQVYDFWQTFIGQPVVLVGNSIGSLVCLVAAAAHPDMVSGIALLNLPDVSLREEALPGWLQPIINGLEGMVASPPLLRTLFKVLRRPSVVRRWAGIAYASRASVTDELVEILAIPAQDEGATKTFSTLFQAVRKPQFAPPVKTVLPTLKIPILLIWGSQDRMVPSSLAKSFLGLNPQLELVELDKAGHCPHDECPEQFNQILLYWIEAGLSKTTEEESQL